MNHLAQLVRYSFTESGYSHRNWLFPPTDFYRQGRGNCEVSISFMLQVMISKVLFKNIIFGRTFSEDFDGKDVLCVLAFFLNGSKLGLVPQKPESINQTFH